jgi:hypothetical protein
MRLRLIAAIGAAVMGFALLSTPAMADGRHGDRYDRHGSYGHRDNDCSDRSHYSNRGHRRHADNRGWGRRDGDRHRGHRYDRNDRRWNDGDRRHRDNDRGRRGRDRDRDGRHDRHDH